MDQLENTVIAKRMWLPMMGLLLGAALAAGPALAQQITGAPDAREFPDTGTPVDDQDYRVPFAFTGKLSKITIDLGESSVSPAAIRKMMQELAEKRDR
jgi:hypothetical protein